MSERLVPTHHITRDETDSNSLWSPPGHFLRKQGGTDEGEKPSHTYQNKRHYLRVKTTGEQLEGGAGPMTGKPCAQAQEDI